jgi:hypothetical protein
VHAEGRLEILEILHEFLIVENVEGIAELLTQLIKPIPTWPLKRGACTCHSGKGFFLGWLLPRRTGRILSKYCWSRDTFWYL